MNKKESLVEDTFIQLKNLEDVIAENAQGILASTMKQEIKELVKESLNEQEDEDEIELDAEVDTDADNDEMEMDMDFDDEEMDVDTDMDFDDEEMDMDMDVEDDTIDLTGASDEEILRVFKAMGDEDGIIVKKEGGMLHLSDDNEDVEYMVQLGESDDEMELDEMYDEDEDEMEETEMYEDEMEDEESEGVIYELELDDMGNEEEMDMDMDFDDEEMDFEKTPSRRLKPIDSKYFDMTEEDDDDEEDEEYVMESSKFKSKGVGMGSASKFKYDKKPNQGEGFKTKMKQGTRGVGMGKAKFEYKEEVNNTDVEKKSTRKPMVKKPIVKKEETKEASRTLGNGKRWGRNGLDKPKAAPRHLRVESTEVELNLLREKNEEYRKALNLFRTKLNEVATFNSNLAYATRLFTEHSTTKQEKINILRRFDSVDTLKESKNLYKSIKNELSSTSTTDNTITESLERNVVKTPSSGSAMNLIESKTYENPQFLRMKDLMGKLK